MSRRPAADVAVPITIDQISFRLATSTLTHLPDAVAFIRAQLHKGISGPVAAEYARLTAKAMRLGYAADPARIISRPERTAVNAYWAWAEHAYHERVTPVLRTFAQHDIRKSLPWLRVGSVVPPREGKQIPRLMQVAQLQLDEETRDAVMTPAQYGWVDAEREWTLHLPHVACPAHQDPCSTCVPVVLTAEQVEVIAAAFEKAWGHRDLTRVPADCLLFGTPPLEGGPAEHKSQALGRIAALIPESALAGTVRQLRGQVTEDVEAFKARLADQNTDVIVISKALAGARLADLLEATRAAWMPAES